MKNPHITKAKKYTRDVLSGKIPACLYVKQACQRQVDNLKSEKKKSYPYRFDKIAAEKICKFAEKMPHVKGKWSGKKIILEPWECFLLTTVFGWLQKKDGLRRFREMYAELPRKSGKSICGAIIGNYMFSADGEPGSEVYSGATTLLQALEVFRPAWLMTQKTDGYRNRFDIELGGTEKNPGNMYSMTTGSRFEAVIGKPGDGASVHCGMVDEYHEHPDDSLYDCFVTGMGARTQPLLAILTTAGTNTSYPCYSKRKQITQVLSGQKENESLFGIIYTVDSTARIMIYTEFNEILATINEVCGCRHAKTIQTKKLLQEIYAKIATIKNGSIMVKNGKQKKKQNGKKGVEIIQTDLEDIKDCVNLVMSKRELTITQKQKTEKTHTKENGVETTEINAELLVNDGKIMEG